MVLKHFILVLCITVLFFVTKATAARNTHCIAAENRMKRMISGISLVKPGYWTRLNDSMEAVCYFYRYDSPGRFGSLYDGFIGSIKLVHIYSDVNCHDGNRRSNHRHRSKWGCNRDPRKPLSVFITDQNKELLFNRTGSDPPGNVHGIRYSSKTFNADSGELVFNRMNDPLYVNTESQLSIWYGEDLKNIQEENNEGQTCVDVYAHFV